MAASLRDAVAKYHTMIPVGVLIAGGGLVYAVRLAWGGGPVDGWGAIGELQMVMLRVLGEYSWRALG